MKLYIVCYQRVNGTWEPAPEGCYDDYNVAAMHVELQKARKSVLKYIVFEAVPADKPAVPHV